VTTQNEHPECTCIPGAYSGSHERHCAITEDDVRDDEVEEMQAFVRCEICDYGDAAERMTRDESGAWLCWPCSRGEGRE
jgi:hypothetical protein